MEKNIINNKIKKNVINIELKQFYELILYLVKNILFMQKFFNN